MQLIASDSTALEVRQAAAVNFKNHVKYHWVRAPLGAQRLRLLSVAAGRPLTEASTPPHSAT